MRIICGRQIAVVTGHAIFNSMSAIDYLIVAAELLPNRLLAAVISVSSYPVHPASPAVYLRVISASFFVASSSSFCRVAGLGSSSPSTSVCFDGLGGWLRSCCVVFDGVSKPFNRSGVNEC
jgi:hypothetical protein